MLSRNNLHFYDLRQTLGYAGALWLSNNNINSEGSHLFLHAPFNYMSYEKENNTPPWDIGGRDQPNKQRRVVVGHLVLARVKMSCSTLKTKE